ncbi:MAG: hypothetical protein AAGF96_03605 [Bacteroidota bacterium]
MKTRIGMYWLMLNLSVFNSCMELGKQKDTAVQNERNALVPFAEMVAETPIKFEPDVVSLEESAEFGITFTQDMKTLFFTSKRGEDEHFTIYTSSFKAGKWQTAKVASFSGSYFDADACIAPDGQQLFFFSMRPTEEKDTIPLEMPNIWYTLKKGELWETPKPVEGLLNTPTSGEGYLSMSRDNTIYFSSVGRLQNKPHDVFKSQLAGEDYSEPQYVTLDIETNFSNPFIAPNEDYLIIDSRQPGGLGGNDLYFVKHIGDNKWASPVNMGGLINTIGDEGTPSLSPDGKWFFFSRDGDIYFVSAEKAFEKVLSY